MTDERNGSEKMVRTARLTAEELWRLGEGDVRRELVDGAVVEMAPPTWRWRSYRRRTTPWTSSRRSETTSRRAAGSSESPNS